MAVLRAKQKEVEHIEAMLAKMLNELKVWILSTEKYMILSLLLIFFTSSYL